MKVCSKIAKAAFATAIVGTTTKTSKKEGRCQVEQANELEIVFPNNDRRRMTRKCFTMLKRKSTMKTKMMMTTTTTTTIGRRMMRISDQVEQRNEAGAANEDDNDDRDVEFGQEEEEDEESDESEWERANGYRADNEVLTYRDISSDEEDDRCRTDCCRASGLVPKTLCTYPHSSSIGSRRQ